MEPAAAPKRPSAAKAVLIAALTLGGILATYSLAFAADPSPTPSTAPSAPASPGTRTPGTGTHADCPGM